MAEVVQLTGCIVELGRQVALRDGEEIGLTTAEARLFAYLADHPQRDISHGELLREVWGYPRAVQSRAAYHAVRRLRQKLELDPAQPEHLLTVRGVGYRFEPLVAEPTAAGPVVPTGAANATAPTYQWGSTRVVLYGHVGWRGEESFVITPQENTLLAELLATPGQPVRRAHLFRKLWGHAPDERSRAIDHAVWRLRERLESDPKNPEILLTVRGAGYQIRPPDVLNEGVTKLYNNAFVGRADQREQVLSWWQQGIRGVTLVGPGGFGKSRLASQIAADWPTAARFISCGDCSSSIDLLAAIAHALSTPLDAVQQGREAAAVLHAIDTHGRILLILDDLSSFGSELVSQILDQATEAFVLATSRSPVGYAAEHLCRLGPMPDDDARELFLQRRPSNLPRLSRSQLNLTLRGLAGNPHAIERAASTAEPDPSPVSNENERMARDWDRFSPDLQHALCQLTVFRGGFDVEAVEAVVVPLDEESPMGLELLEELHDAALVQIRQTDPHARLTLLDVVNEVATERCPAPLLQETRTRHRAHFAARAKRMLETAPGAQLAPLRRAMLADYENLRWAVTNPPTEDIPNAEECAYFLCHLARDRAGARGLEAALALARECTESPAASDAIRIQIEVMRLWQLKHGGHLVEAMNALLDLERMALSCPSADARILWRVDLAHCYLLRAEFELAVELLEAAMSETPESPRRARIAMAGLWRARCAWSLAEPNAMAFFDRALTFAREMDDPRAEVLGLMMHGDIAYIGSDFERAGALLRQCQKRARAHGFIGIDGAVMSKLARNLNAVRKYAEAEQMAIEATQMFRFMGNTHNEALSMGHLGYARFRQGYPAEGAKMVADAILLHKKTNNLIGEGLCEGLLGLIALYDREWSPAVEHFERSALLSMEGRSFVNAYSALGYWACAEALCGNAAPARAAWKRSDELTGHPQSPLTVAFSQAIEASIRIVDTGAVDPEALAVLAHFSADDDSADEWTRPALWTLREIVQRYQ